MSKNNFKVGDKVRKYKDPSKKKITDRTIFTVIKVLENQASQTGIILDVGMPECPHCGARARKILGYDSAWFEKVQPVQND